MPIPEVTLDDAQIRRMLNDHRFTNAFPFLRVANTQIVRRRKGCGGCGGRRNVASPAAAAGLEQVRRQIAMLPQGRRDVLKRLLDTKQVRVRYIRPGATMPTEAVF